MYRKYQNRTISSKPTHWRSTSWRQ